ncbi:MAG: hypothetical protein NZ959_09460 [Armatimonadetes bacterium]|nr:hypothetical protein [Armatimonadota bacterium]MDW8122186.1 hypothetical protein [Armatimonadota bacterium]
MRYYNKDDAADREWASRVYHSALEVVNRVCRRSAKPVPVDTLYDYFRSAHPELCNDAIVDPNLPHQPKWKHLLRSAVERLKRDGVIRRVSGGWIAAD